MEATEGVEDVAYDRCVEFTLNEGRELRVIVAKWGHGGQRKSPRLRSQSCANCICAVKPRITLRDLAAAAGLSVSGVSQALRNQPAIPPDTRARVQALARKMGYRPDPALAALNHYRHRRRVAATAVVLAYVTAYPTRDGWRKIPFFQKTFDGAKSRAAKLGYRVEHFWKQEKEVSPDRFCDILSARGIRGLLIAPLPQPAGALDLRWDEFAGVAIGPSLVHPTLHSACNNHYQSMLLALDELQTRGYRRVGLVLDPQVDQRHQRKYFAAFSVHGSGQVVTPLLVSSLDDHGLSDWLERERPDAVVAHDESVKEALCRLRKRVPRDIGFVSLIRQNPELSGIDTSPEMIAGLAVDRLVGMLHEGETGVPELPTCTMLNGRWVDGTSVRARPALSAERVAGTPGDALVK